MERQKPGISGDARVEESERRAPLGLVDVEVRLRADPVWAAARCNSGDVLLELSAVLVRQLRRLARQQQVSIFAMLLSGWVVLLGRWSGEDEVSIGLRKAKRPDAEPERSCSEDASLLRVNLRDDPPFEPLLKQVNAALREAHAPRSLETVEGLKLVVRRAPLLELLIDRSDSSVDAATARSELSLFLEEAEGCIEGRVDGAGDLFPQDTVARMAASWQVLLKGLVKHVRRPVSRLSMLTIAERNLVLYRFNETAPAGPQSRTIHELFEQQVHRAPHAPGVTYREQSLTYAELNCRANQLARYLADRGVGPDELVGICVERSLEMVVGLLGILKAGGAYVPLDPSSPAERLAYLLEDAAPRVLLTQEKFRTALPVFGAHVVVLDSDWNEIAQQSSADVDAEIVGVRPHHLAYVIYTSGSTGKPKGVMVEHRNVTRLFAATDHWFHFNERDVWTLFHSFAFDFSVWELWGALLYGGRVVVVDHLTARSPQQFYRLLCEEGVTVLNQTPSAFAQLIDAQARTGESQHSLRFVIFGGEALELRKLIPWVEQNGAECPQLINMYGITETTVHVTYRVLTREEIGSERGSPIGRPIPDLKVYLLDRHRQPVPIGVVGDIYVGGAGLARGYLNRPELTAERFLLNPFGSDPQERLYKSGDLGRWRPDGTLEYLGRNDQQVKIRGFRIELGEIEAQLARHAEVKEAAVVVREDTPGEKRLVAYVIPGDAAGAQAAPSVEELRVHLKSALPEYMVPSAFVRLERFPLTVNGKLDRRALPAPELDAYTSRPYEAPRGEVEEVLAGIWRELLHVDRAGRHDNFFELGGHSLLIVELMERLRRVDLSTDVRRVFDSPTLADLASALTHETAPRFQVPPNLIPAGCAAITPQMLPLVELEREEIARIERMVPGGSANIQDIYPLAPLQEGILFHHMFNEQGGDTYVLTTLLSVASRGRLEELIRALQAVIDRHDILRSAVLWEQLPRPVQVVHRRAALPVEEEVLDPYTAPLEQLGERMRPERQRLELRQAPMMRLEVAKDPQGTAWYALLRTHHLVCDNESLEILLGEVMAHLDGRAKVLPAPVPYRNHVAQALAHARANEAADFFRSKLGDIDEPTAPFGLLDVHGDGSQIEEAHQTLEPALGSRIRRQARRLSVSPATILHAAWGLVVARTSGRDDVVFGSVLLGRLQGSAGAQRILGMFINTLPLRLRLQDVTAKELVRQTHRELVELLSYEQASLPVAQRCSGVTGGTPLFSALLNYRHSVPNPETDWSAAEGVRVLLNQERTNYPITLSVDDLGEALTVTAQTDRRIDPRRVVEYLSAAIQSLVQALEDAPSTSALALSILPERERLQLLRSFNATAVAYPRTSLVHELFEQQAQRTPNAAAVVYEGRSLTYAELNAKANQLARYLVGRGVSAGQLVGVCVDRSIEMVVGLLAILKAGAAYLPIDPHYPPERITYMLDDAAPGVVLTQRKLTQALRGAQVKTVLLDEELDELAGNVEENPSARQLGLTSENLVYVIYTSGSTGRPKGTAMRHCSMVNLIEWHRSCFGEQIGVRTLQFAALSFDVAFQETFSTLCDGGTLVLLDEWVRRDARALTEFLSKHSIQRLFLPPLMLQGVAEHAQSTGAAPMSLQDVITAGEQLHITPEVSALFERLPSCRLHNHYGPTETHVVTALTLTGDRALWPALPAIGKPIANTQIYVLDRHRQLVPTGVTGEIHIGGAGVARGYLNRPELTAERFLRNPFSSDPQERLYKTGDLGRWRADGTLEYLGRNDQQVKIRGFRIELGEIEAQLARHAQVKESAVAIREDTPGEKRLVAYVVPRDPASTQTTLSVEELRAHLKSVLPEHMVPSAFVTMERLPLTPSGKLDRKALPAPELDAYASEQYEPPQSEVERVLAGIWQRLLRVERVGRRDNFFELGGHSLLATRVISHIGHLLDVDIPIRVIFKQPTIEALSLCIEKELAAETSMEVP